MPISIISIKADHSFRELLENISQSHHLGPVAVLDDYIDPTSHVVQVNAEPGDTPVAFISLDDDCEAGLATAAIFQKMQRPRFGVVAASSSRDAEVIIRIVKSGYCFLSLPATGDETVAALKKVAATGNSQAGPKSSGRVFAFAGTSGGAGTTTIAGHVAVALATEGNRTILVDHHRGLGHQALYLDIHNNGQSIYELIKNAAGLDDSLLSSYVIPHVSGLDVLCSPEVVVGNMESAAGDLTDVISFLRTRYSYVIFDSVAGDPDLEAVASVAERVFFVTSAEVAPMRDLLRYAEYYGKGDSKYQVVVNHEGRSVITASHVASHTGLAVAAKFAELVSSVPAATNAGKTVGPEVRGFHESLNDLLNVIDPQEVPEGEQPKKSWLSWTRKR